MNYNKFFKCMTRNLICDPNFYKLFSTYNIDPHLWPKCESKELAIKFWDLVANKSLEYAQFHFVEQGEKLPAFDFIIEKESFYQIFLENKNEGLFYDLGIDLTKNPKFGDLIVSTFKKENNQNIGITEMRAYLSKFLDKNQTKNHISESNKIIEIPDWPLLSNLCKGFNGKRIILFISGTGVGKTTIALNIAMSASKAFPVLFFNMEMGIEDISSRLVQIGSRITSKALRKLSEDEKSEEKVANFFSNFLQHNEFFMSEGKALGIEEISQEIFERKEKNNIHLVVIDYDQKIRTKHYGSEEWKTLQVAIEKLEEVAKATDTCILILSQGDEDNLPKASKRIMQSATAIFSLVKNQSDEYFLETKKNRFGKKENILLQCDFETYFIAEKSLIQPKKTNEVYKI